MSVLEILALIWAIGAAATFGIIAWAGADDDFDRGDWAFGVLAAVFWPLSVVWFIQFWARGRK